MHPNPEEEKIIQQRPANGVCELASSSFFQPELEAFCHQPAHQSTPIALKARQRTIDTTTRPQDAMHTPASF